VRFGGFFLEGVVVHGGAIRLEGRLRAALGFGFGGGRRFGFGLAAASGDLDLVGGFCARYWARPGRRRDDRAPCGNDGAAAAQRPCWRKSSASMAQPPKKAKHVMMPNM
jgi:hypothetical protein